MDGELRCAFDAIEELDTRLANVERHLREAIGELRRLADELHGDLYDVRRSIEHVEGDVRDIRGTFR